MLAFTPSNTGWHAVVVYRSSGLDPWGVTYTFSWDLAAAGVPGASGTASKWSFSQPSPNPMTQSSKLHFELPAAGQAQLSLYDASGRRIRSLVAGSLSAGPHEAIWDGTADDGRRVASGVYWARLDAEGRSEVRMITVVQ